MLLKPRVLQVIADNHADNAAAFPYEIVVSVVRCSVLRNRRLRRVHQKRALANLVGRVPDWCTFPEFWVHA